MKTVMYISQSIDAVDKSGLPRSLASIVVGSRKKNRANGVRSLMCYHNGYYMHAIEGKMQVIDNLLKAIKKDEKHGNITILINALALKNYLDDFSFKLVSVSELNKAFVKYINTYLFKNYSSDISVGQIFKDLELDTNKIQNQKPRFSGYTLALTNWPTFNILAPSRELLELCAILTTTRINYQELSDKNPYSNLEALNDSLENLDNLKLLELTEVKEKLSSTSTTNTFFNKIRALIKRSST